MAKKTNNDNNFWNLLAMIALLLIGIATILGAIISNEITVVFTAIASLIAFAMVTIRAFYWIKGKGLVWLIIYIVCVAAWIVGYGIILF